MTPDWILGLEFLSFYVFMMALTHKLRQLRDRPKQHNRRRGPIHKEVYGSKNEK
jgi:hypothetical protein